jgi:hypothetical protein
MACVLDARIIRTTGDCCTVGIDRFLKDWAAAKGAQP